MDENIEKMLTIPKGFDIVVSDELPETVGAEKRKDKTPTEERIVVNQLFMNTCPGLSRSGFLF